MKFFGSSNLFFGVPTRNILYVLNKGNAHPDLNLEEIIIKFFDLLNEGLDF